MISPETVTETWERISDTSPDQVQEIIEQMEKEQPEVMAYLMAMAEQPPFDQHESEIIFYIGMVVWQIMRQSPRGISQVTEKTLDLAEKANEELLEMLSSDTEADFVSATQHMLKTHTEPNVLGYIVEAIMEEEDRDPDDPPLRDESKGMAFLYLKIVLDALVASQNNA